MTLIPFSSSLTKLLTTALLNIDSFPYYYLLLPIQYNAIYHQYSVTDLQNTSIIHILHVLLRIQFRIRIFYLLVSFFCSTETCQTSKPSTYCICSFLRYLPPLARINCTKDDCVRSQNHRIEVDVGRDLWRSSCSTPLSNLGQIVQEHVEIVF